MLATGRKPSAAAVLGDNSRVALVCSRAARGRSTDPRSPPQCVCTSASSRLRRPLSDMSGALYCAAAAAGGRYCEEAAARDARTWESDEPSQSPLDMSNGAIHAWTSTNVLRWNGRLALGDNSHEIKICQDCNVASESRSCCSQHIHKVLARAW